MRYLCAALIAALAGVGEVAWAYEEITVTDGGSLSGTISLEGQVPRPKGYNLTILPDQFYCGRISDGQGWRLLQPFNVGPAGQFIWKGSRRANRSLKEACPRSRRRTASSSRSRRLCGTIKR